MPFNIQCRRYEDYVLHPTGQVCPKSIEKYTNTKSDGYFLAPSDRNPGKEVCVSLIRTKKVVMHGLIRFS